MFTIQKGIFRYHSHFLHFSSMEWHLESAKNKLQERDNRKRQLLVEHLFRGLRVENQNAARMITNTLRSEVALALGRTKDKIAVGIIIVHTI